MNFKSFYKLFLEDTNLSKIKIKRDLKYPNVYIAYIDRRVAGKLIIDVYSDPKTVFKVAVNTPYKRQGVATALYKKAEEDYGKLTPSSALSDEGFLFWNNYRKEAVENDLRQYKDLLIGKPVEERGMKGIIKDVSSKIVCALIDGKKEGETNSIFCTRNIKNLLPEGVYEKIFK